MNKRIARKIGRECMRGRRSSYTKQQRRASWQKQTRGGGRLARMWRTLRETAVIVQYATGDAP